MLLQGRTQLRWLWSKAAQQNYWSEPARRASISRLSELRVEMRRAKLLLKMQKWKNGVKSQIKLSKSFSNSRETVCLCVRLRRQKRKCLMKSTKRAPVSTKQDVSAQRWPRCTSRRGETLSPAFPCSPRVWKCEIWWCHQVLRTATGLASSRAIVAGFLGWGAPAD